METRMNKGKKTEGNNFEANKRVNRLIDEDWTNLGKVEGSSLYCADSLGIDKDKDENCECEDESYNNVAGLKVNLKVDKPRSKFRIVASRVLDKVLDPRFVIFPVICLFVISFLLDVFIEMAKTSETSVNRVQQRIEKVSVIENSQIIESQTISSTEVESIAYQQDLSLTNPEANPYITLAVDGVTVVESDEPIIKVINPNKSLSIEESTFPTKKLYLVGREALESGNFILVTKSHTFNVYYEIRSVATPGNFNVLVKIKK